MAKKRTKKRRSPRKAAVTQEQVVEQLQRFQRLLDQWLDEQEGLTTKVVAAQKKIKAYRKKVKYYQSRLEDAVDDCNPARPLRSIQVE